MDSKRGVPEELNHPFFLTNEAGIWEKQNGKEMQIFPLFYYEWAFYSNIEALKPWEDPVNYVPLLFDEWKSLKDSLAQLFQNRNQRRTETPMKKGVGLFVECLFWTNAVPVVLSNLDHAEKLMIKPVNMRERLQFIMNRPTLYHSFIQLSVLMTELEKAFMKHLALRKKH
ncbi:hypothetical protein CVD25_01585 [Bacillus canaveralius]|uniref:YpoC-like domain-containing protein n=1 Tax=Bacillus canaveralius TaxID=1403243 RepID=A0A2N5GI03_9BACI|nr:hypothetical protein [Bacillus canaveralius]PLR80452.1 hypothetical protein CU635_18115 [Bacillus canaveralius]PLS00683.1 hypothetical protein CVD25_01585 [Bacillus canaveralius]